MKVSLIRYDNKVFGVELAAQTNEEDKTLHRFWEGGIKINNISPRINNTTLGLTFLDLVGSSLSGTKA